MGGMPVIKLGVRRTRRFRRGMMKPPAGDQDGDDDWCQTPATGFFRSAGVQNRVLSG